MFILGFFAGLLIAIFVIITIIYFRYPIEKVFDHVSTKVSQAGPQPRGMIIEPLSEEDEMREKIIEENKRNGRPTPIDQLRSK
jgi:hypothetical protein